MNAIVKSIVDRDAPAHLNDHNLLDIDATRELYKKLQSTVLDHLSK